MTTSVVAAQPKPAVGRRNATAAASPDVRRSITHKTRKRSKIHPQIPKLVKTRFDWNITGVTGGQFVFRL
ncbi:hypothetical protein Dimus_029347, partial [Dionaea muscipula]